MHKTVVVTQSDIEKGLQKLGLQPGYAVEVHSSLNSFGWVDGGAETVVDALMRIIGEQGAIVMSAYPVSKTLPLTDEEREMGIEAKVRIYDESYDGPTGMGAIADAFRHRSDTLLGKGIHRVCAWGRDAAKHVDGYHYLLEVDGWVLLLGVGIGYCSSMHQAEAVGIPEEIKAFVKVPDDIKELYPEDIYIAYGHPPADGWQKVFDEADRRGLVNRRTIGQAECLLFKARSVVDIYEQALRTDPLGLFGIGTHC